jgi:hypothetical protein
VHLLCKRCTTRGEVQQRLAAGDLRVDLLGISGRRLLGDKADKKGLKYRSAALIACMLTVLGGLLAGAAGGSSRAHPNAPGGRAAAAPAAGYVPRRVGSRQRAAAVRRRRRGWASWPPLPARLRRWMADLVDTYVAETSGRGGGGRRH